MKLKLFLLTALTVVGLLLPINAQAVTSTLSVRLGQPKTPTNQDNFKLTFVALDINGGDITVKCYKKSPSDSNYVKFDSDKPLIPGGNTDSCSVDSGILNTAGTYYFKVIANNSLESNIVAVDFNTSGPGTPEAYNKERVDDCNYKINFKSANDGKTVKIELFRSDTDSIAINSGNVAASVSIAPDTAGEIINRIPTCGKDYYYAIRAVDAYGNVSGVAGDSFTSVTTTTTTSTTTETANPSAIKIGSGSQVTQPTEEGTEATLNPTTEQNSSESATPEVLGTTTTKTNYLRWIELAILLVSAYILFRPKKRA